MVEKITVNPEKIRAYGNIITPKNASDYDTYENTVTKTTDTVYGATETVFSMIPPVYTMSFDSASYTTTTGSLNLQVTVLKGAAVVNNATVTVTGGGSGTGTGTTGITGVANITVTGITQSGTLTATYKTGKATATVTYEQASYSLAFSQDTYTPGMLDDVTVYVTLKDNGVAMSGKTITFTYYNGFSTETETAITNSNGVASLWLEGITGTVTATYQGVTATCTIESGGGII